MYVRIYIYMDRHSLTIVGVDFDACLPTLVPCAHEF